MPEIPQPTTTPLPTTIINPSKYATDSAILEIESQIIQTESDLNSVDLNESELTPPSLDMNVNFEK
jgi:hypothetical protein